MRVFGVLGVVCFGLMTHISFGQEVDYGKIHSMAKRGVDSLKANGMAFAIVKDGDVVFQSGYGVEDAETNKKISPTSMFGIASLSKAFTAATIAQLVEEGVLNWNDKVTQHLPEWRLHNDTITALMTVEDLLCHRSGLLTFDGDLLWYGTNYSREEIIERIQLRPMTKQYRRDYGYQNIMYISAGELIERVTGKSWDENIQERFFKPLGMTHSNTSISDYSETHSIAYPHIDGKKLELMSYDNSGGTAAINSNLTDLSKWMTMWANGGVYEGDTILSPASYRHLTRLHTSLDLGGLDQLAGTEFKGYGLGWFMFDFQGKKVVHHGGGLPGYITKLAFVPSENLALIILTNDMSAITTALMYDVLEEMMGEDEQDYLQIFTSFVNRSKVLEAQKLAAKDAKRDLSVKPSLEKEEYVGRYTDVMYGDAEVRIEGKRRKARLVLSLLPSKELFTGTLEPFKGDTYRVVFNDPFLPPGYVTFNVEEGACTGFTIDLENPDFHFYKLNFTKK